LRRRVLTLRLSGRRLRHVFLQQRLKNHEDDEGENKDEKKPSLGAWFLLRIFKVWQSFIKYLGG
jgi:hypothetical protein